MAGVELLNIEKRFPDGTRAVKDLTVRVEDGELLVLLGPSGCGKSTLLRILAGLEPPSAGEIRIDDKVVNSLSPRQRNIAMVFQNYALYPHMTVRGNLEFPLRMLKVPKAERAGRVEEVARTLELTTLLDRKPKELSGGQGQRVAMGRAMVREPTLFLMDEPLSNLDAKLRLQIRNEIAALQKRMRTTMLYVTHDQVEAMTLGMRVALLRDGELQQLGTPHELYDRPGNLFTAAFLGSPAMNICLADIVERDGRPALALDTQYVPLDQQALPSRQEPYLAGLRPEAFAWPEERPQLPSIEIEVALLESLGHEQIVYFQAPVPVADVDQGPDVTVKSAGTSLLAARLPADRDVKAAQKIRLAVDPNKFYWFDRSGKTLSL